MLRLWLFIAIVLTALSMGLSCAHLLELPPKMSIDRVKQLESQVYSPKRSIGSS
jgi:hypothetical protein